MSSLLSNCNKNSNSEIQLHPDFKNPGHYSIPFSSPENGGGRKNLHCFEWEVLGSELNTVM